MEQGEGETDADQENDEEKPQAEEAAARIVRRLEEQGVDQEQIRDMLEDVEDDGDGAALRAIERAIGAAETSQEPDYLDLSLDSLLATYEAARAAGACGYPVDYVLPESKFDGVTRQMGAHQYFRHTTATPTAGRARSAGNRCRRGARHDSRSHDPAPGEPGL